MDDGASVLDRLNEARMLIHILSVGEVGSMDFGRMTTCWKAVDETLGALVDAGLLEVHIPRRGRRVPRYTLTDRGRCVAVLERPQRECLDGEVPDEVVGLSEKMGMRMDPPREGE